MNEDIFDWNTNKHQDLPLYNCHLVPHFTPARNGHRPCCGRKFARSGPPPDSGTEPPQKPPATPPPPFDPTYFPLLHQYQHFTALPVSILLVCRAHTSYTPDHRNDTGEEQASTTARTGMETERQVYVSSAAGSERTPPIADADIRRYRATDKRQKRIRRCDWGPFYLLDGTKGEKWDCGDIETSRNVTDEMPSTSTVFEAFHHFLEGNSLTKLFWWRCYIDFCIFKSNSKTIR